MTHVILQEPARHSAALLPKQKHIVHFPVSEGKPSLLPSCEFIVSSENTCNGILKKTYKKAHNYRRVFKKYWEYLNIMLKQCRDNGIM